MIIVDKIYGEYLCKRIDDFREKMRIDAKLNKSLCKRDPYNSQKLNMLI